MMNLTLPNHKKRAPSRMAHAQRGVVLIIALIVLVAMSLGGVAILRSVDTATLIAGNYAFKQGSLQGANVGIESAIQWLATNNSNLNTDSTGYQSWSSRLSAQRYKWEDPTVWANAKTVGTDAAGNTVQYIIHRLCTQPGKAGEIDPVTLKVVNPCATNIGSGSDAALAAPGQGDSSTAGASAFTSPPRMYLRVIARSVGPRNAVSYVQAMVLVPI